jgi:hypothetical protein
MHHFPEGKGTMVRSACCKVNFPVLDLASRSDGSARALLHPALAASLDLS